MARRTVVLGFYGATLDGGTSAKRWDKWRPTVALCQHDDLGVDELQLLHTPASRKGAELVARDIGQVSPATRVVLAEIGIHDPWDFEEVFAALHEFSRHYSFDTTNHRYLVHITTGSHVMQICWFLLTESRHFPAVLLQTSPARSKHSPAGEYRLIDLDLSRYDRLARRFDEERESDLAFLKAGIDTQNAAFNRLIERIELVALRSREPVLLSGPTGAGKSQLCQRIYSLKRARGLLQGPLVEVNCATIRGDAAASTLFGHVRGAFTGAAAARKGLLSSADGGLLVLDEIGELGGDEQAMLLRAIEEKKFFPVGADREVSSNFQLIAGTNRDLRSAVKGGTFREDLLARINTWAFALPGLAERPEDLAPNLLFELERAGARLGKRITMNQEARDRFLAFARSPEAVWTANFRDFTAAVLRMATLAHGGRIDEESVADEEERLLGGWRAGESLASSPLQPLLGGALDDIDPFDQVQLAEVVRVCRASKSLSAAGRVLFSASRKKKQKPNDADRLAKYLARFGLTWPLVTAGRF
ncbi:MAG TPA: RNA repair transcriptional activator RtcR [Polyangiaceae bacterium]|nr:RNA repair transcriptional activator RtcR [Polyangiaceae bacterium]